MHILVTGGTGFIGRALCPALLAAGYGVTVLSRKPAQKTGLPAQVRMIGTLAEAQGITGIINLAGEPLAEGRWNAARKQAFRQSRLGTTQALLQWLEALPQKPGVLVSGSAIGYYGAHGDELLDESAPAASDFAAQLCRDWEQEAIKAEALGLRVCRVRIGIVLGRDGGALAKMLTPFKLGAGGPMGSGTQWMSWITRQDLVQLMLWLLDNPQAQGAYNGTAPTPVNNRTFSTMLGAALHRPAVLPMPAVVLKLMFGEMASLLLEGQRVMPDKALAEGFQFHHPALSAALQAVLQE